MRHHVEAWRPDDDQRVTLSGGPARVDASASDPDFEHVPVGFAARPRDVQEPRAEELLTDDEHRAIALAGELMSLLTQIVGDGPHASSDRAELVPPIHVIQRAVMKQAAARAYPDLYRLLGQERADR